MSKKTKSPKKDKQPNKEDGLYNNISIAIDSRIKIEDEDVRTALINELYSIFISVDQEIQIIRDIRLREFLQKHVNNKQVSDFLDSLSNLKIVDYLASKSTNA